MATVGTAVLGAATLGAASLGAATVEGLDLRIPVATQFLAEAAFAGGSDVLLTADITLSGNLQIPANRTLHCGWHTITANGGVLVELDGDGATVRDGVFVGTSTYAVQWSATRRHRCVVAFCEFTTTGLRVLQGSTSASNAAGHTSPVIEDSTFNDAVLFIERALAAVIRRNTLARVADAGNIVTYGLQDSEIVDNVISGGRTGILFLNQFAISRIRFRANTIARNTITDVSEEGISVDMFGGSAAVMSGRDMDDVSSLPGSSQVVLTNALWTGDTTYNHALALYQMLFIDGPMVGKYYSITEQSGATFTLDIPDHEYDALEAGDRACIGLVNSENVIEDNVVSYSTAGTAGILLWGGCNSNIIRNNTVTMADPGDWAILVSTLAALTPAGVLSSLLTWPSESNQLRGNTVVSGIVTQRCQSYGAIDQHTPFNNFEDGSPMVREGYPC